MNAAAQRVKSQATSLGIFDNVLAFVDSDLASACSDVYLKYGTVLNPSHKGFGYFSWKVELVNSALMGKFGEYDGIVWVDAGCEIFNSCITRFRLRKWLKRSEKQGVFAYTLDTPEQDYTKQSLFDYFPHLNKNDRSPQFQATWFILHGETGRLIANQWFKVALQDISTLDLSPSPNGEVASFVEHRFDQSILSLVLKQLMVKPRKYSPAAGVTGSLSQLRAKLLHPIWTSRNRSGNSVVRNFLI
jgi:hypothetical protein